MKWLGRLFGRLYVGDMVEVIGSMQNAPIRLRLAHPNYGTIKEFSKDRKMALLDFYFGNQAYVKVSTLKRIG